MQELRAAGPTEPLASAVGQAASKALQLIVSKVEYAAAPASETRAVSGPAHQGQLRNFALAASVGEVERYIDGLRPGLTEQVGLPLSPLAGICLHLTRLPADVHAQVQAALGPGLAQLSACVGSLLSPLLRSMSESLEKDLLGMHSVDYAPAQGAQQEVTETSAYVAELSARLQTYRMEYLSKLAAATSYASESKGKAGAAGRTVGELMVERFATRIVLLFLRHASLLRGVQGAGRLQLAKDLSEFEAAVSQAGPWPVCRLGSLQLQRFVPRSPYLQYLCPLELLGAVQRALRSFRHLLFTETPDVLASPLAREVPATLLAHHLLSRAGGALPTPMARHGLTPQQYSLWLDNHSPVEVLRGIRQCAEEIPPGTPPAALEIARAVRLACEGYAV